MLSEYNSRATPCDGFGECFNNVDEDCSASRFNLFAVLFILLFIMIIAYDYMLKKIKDEAIDIPKDQIYKDNYKHAECINYTGNELANLKVVQRLILIIKYN